MTKTEQEKYVLFQFGMTHRQFRIRKRQELEAMWKLFQEFQRGSAAIPRGMEMCDGIAWHMGMLRKNMSAKRWGR